MLPIGGIPLWGLIAGIALTIFGTVAMLVGYLALVHDYGHRAMTGGLIAITQLAWIPFIVDLTATGMGAQSDPTGNPFIPAAYNPTSADVKFFGAMGIMAIMAYGTGFLGSLSFMEFCLFAYQSGKPTDRSAGYYRSRMNLYMCLLSLAGVTQLLLGIFVLSTAGSGPLEWGPIAVAMYVIHFSRNRNFCRSRSVHHGSLGFGSPFRTLERWCRRSLLSDWYDFHVGHCLVNDDHDANLLG
jgi:hypothetical protein